AAGRLVLVVEHYAREKPEAQRLGEIREEVGLRAVYELVIDAADERLVDVQEHVADVRDDAVRIALNQVAEHAVVEALVDDALLAERADRVAQLDPIPVCRELQTGNS